ncbi:hypothetical protein D3C76_1412380 [compost metagenome]
MAVGQVAEDDVAVQEPFQLRVVVPRPHVVQTVRVGHDSVSAVILERLVGAAFMLFQLAIDTVGVTVRYASLFIGQQRGAAADIAVVTHVVAVSIFPADEAQAVDIEGCWRSSFVQLHEYPA